MAWRDYFAGSRQGNSDGVMVKVQELEEQLIKARVQMSILTGQKDTAPTSGDGDYTTRDALIEGVSRKFAATDKWGSELVQRLTKIRSAFVMAGGIEAKASDEVDRDSVEMEYIQDFIEQNDLDGAYALALGDEKVIEGQILIGLDWVSDPESPFGGYARINYYSYYASRYKVAYVDGSPARGMERAVFNNASGGLETVENTYATFMKFNARINDLYGTSDFGGILKVLDNLSKSLEQWYAMNWLFAHPTPVFTTDNIQEGIALTQYLNDTLWKLGSFFAGPAKLELVSGAGDSGSIENNITMDARIVSGKMGVPVQWMGFPDLMSNRATADNTMEPVEVISAAERQVWETGFQDVFDKAIALRNAQSDMGSVILTPGLIEPIIPFISARQLKMLTEFYLPAHLAGVISLESLLGMIPDIQADEEQDRLKAEAEGKREDEIARGVEVVQRLDAFRASQGAQGGGEGENNEETEED